MIQRLGVRGKLFVVSIALIATVVVASGAYLEGELRRLIEGQLHRELARHAQTVFQAYRGLAPNPARGELVDWVDRLGVATGTRVTLIAADGAVEADSSVAPSGLADLDNHRNRPEILAAHNHGQGISRRYSATLRRPMLYAAVLNRPDGRVIRTAMPLSLVEAAIARLRLLLLVAAALGLLVAIVMSGLASYWLSRTLKALVAQVRLVARGETRRVQVSSRDELGTLGRSVNRIAADLRHTVSALVAERDRQSTVLESMHEGVLALSADLTVETSNVATVELLELNKSPEGRRLLETVQIPALVELAEQARSGPACAEFTVPGASRRKLLGKGNPLRSSGGAVLVLHDVTDARAAESMRKDLVANVSHELRTPVSIIRANSETLLAGALSKPEAARRFVEAIERNSVRLSSLIADLLDLSRIESGAYPCDPQPLSPRELLDDLTVSFGQRARARHVEVRNEIPPTLKVSADRQSLEQVLLNLVDNAIKYTYESGQVCVTASRDGALVRFEVRDDGPGIDERHRDRIFERFYRVDPGRSRDLGGTGLGLSIVKHLVSLLGGTVGIKSVEPHGSCFWFTVQDAAAPPVTTGPAA